MNQNPSQDPSRLFTDLPFIYAIDPTTLNSESLAGVSIKTSRDGSDFYMRRICNAADFLGGSAANPRLRYYLPQSGAYDANNYRYATDEWVVAPEVKFRGGDDIRFDFLGDPTSQTQASMLAIQGVRRYPTRVNMKPSTPGNWRERWFQYSLNVSLSNPPTDNPIYGDYQLEIFNYDFVLRRIQIVNGPTATVTPGQAATGQCLYTLYDAAGRGLSNIAIPDYFYAKNSPRYQNLFPVPELIYPNGSNIRLTAVAIPNDVPEGPTIQIDQQIIFDGVWRIPCA